MSSVINPSGSLKIPEKIGVASQNLIFETIEELRKKGFGGPNGIRTRVLALRGPRPRPLDDGTQNIKQKNPNFEILIYDLEFYNWLGREDSNPCKQIQSLPSCRWTPPQKSIF